VVFLFVGHFVFDSFSEKLTNIHPYQGILFILFSSVSNVSKLWFPSSSHQVLNVFPIE